MLTHFFLILVLFAISMPMPCLSAIFNIVHAGCGMIAMMMRHVGPKKSCTSGCTLAKK